MSPKSMLPSASFVAVAHSGMGAPSSLGVTVKVNLPLMLAGVRPSVEVSNLVPLSRMVTEFPVEYTLRNTHLPSPSVCTVALRLPSPLSTMCTITVKLASSALTPLGRLDSSSYATYSTVHSKLPSLFVLLVAWPLLTRSASMAVS